jgi:hypothetical protein
VTHLVRIALLTIPILIEAALLLVAVGIFRLLLFLALVFFFLLLALDVLLVLRITIGHECLLFGKGESIAPTAQARCPRNNAVLGLKFPEMLTNC